MIRWHKKKTILGIAIIFFVYLFLRCKKYNVKFNATIPEARPIELWEFVSDFNNMKKLNPTIKDFVIESESGNYEHWKYRVYYTEYLSQIPSLTNFAWADIEAKTMSNNKFAIHSNHKTCFLTSFICVYSESTFVIEPTNRDLESSYTEFITYECPAIFSSFCRKEVMHQRSKIKDSLYHIFKNRQNFNV